VFVRLTVAELQLKQSRTDLTFVKFLKTSDIGKMEQSSGFLVDLDPRTGVFFARKYVGRIVFFWRSLGGVRMYVTARTITCTCQGMDELLLPVGSRFLLVPAHAGNTSEPSGCRGSDKTSMNPCLCARQATD